MSAGAEPEALAAGAEPKALAAGAEPEALAHRGTLGGDLGVKGNGREAKGSEVHFSI